MGISDEKTRPATRAVKRKPAADVAHLTTRRVKAVTRKPVDPLAGLLDFRQAIVLKRAGLLNGTGGKENGWLFRETNATEGLVSFVMRDEPLLVTFSRFVIEQGYDLDIMCAGQCVAMLNVQRVTRRTQATGFVLAPDGKLLAELSVSTGKPRVECLDGKGRVFLRLEEAHPTQHDFLAGRRLVGSLLRIAHPGILLDSEQLDLSFFEGATSLERLVAAAAVVTELFELAKPNNNGGRWEAADFELSKRFK